MSLEILEGVRQFYKKYKRIEKIWKKKAPKGKKYWGYKFVSFESVTKEGFRNMGYRIKPIYKKVVK